MKNKLVALALVAVTITMLSSCFSSRSKYGCPTVSAASKAQKNI
jgi:hypothetical protein